MILPITGILSIKMIASNIFEQSLNPKCNNIGTSKIFKRCLFWGCLPLLSRGTPSHKELSPSLFFIYSPGHIANKTSLPEKKNYLVSEDFKVLVQLFLTGPCIVFSFVVILSSLLFFRVRNTFSVH